jgi:FAD/FMN-containing dehydrogenase
MWNLKKRPFLAISGAHGQASTLNNMTYGVGIYLRGLNSITIADGGTAVWVGGGVQTGELVQYLWNNGKQTGMILFSSACFQMLTTISRPWM